MDEIALEYKIEELYGKEILNIIAGLLEFEMDRR